jgi:hypothetical protein
MNACIPATAKPVVSGFEMEPLGYDHQQWHRDAHAGKYDMERQRHAHLSPRG